MKKTLAINEKKIFTFIKPLAIKATSSGLPSEQIEIR
jgi:hypothetical protein